MEVGQNDIEDNSIVDHQEPGTPDDKGERKKESNDEDIDAKGEYYGAHRISTI